MPFNGSGAFSAPGASFPAVGNTLIESVKYNAVINDIATGLSTAICKDGQTTPTANIPMGGNKITGLGSGLTSRTDAARTGDIQDGTAVFVAAGGTVDAITAAYVPTITAVVDGMLLGVRAAGANTVTTPTFSPNGLTARTIVKQGGQALAIGDIRAANHDLLLRYRATGTVWELLNPTIIVASTASTTEVLTGTDATKAVTPDSLAALWEQGSDIASAGTVGVGEGGYFNVTGTTTITDIDFATDKAGRPAWLKFADALILTHGANLILPGGANITTAAGDVAVFISEGADTVRCGAYQRAVTAPVIAATQAEMEAASSLVAFASPGRVNFHPGVVKTWALFGVDGSINASRNVTSVTDGGTGLWTVNLTTAFADANYAPGSIMIDDTTFVVSRVGAIAAGSFRIEGINAGNSAADPAAPALISCWAFGDQA